LNLGAVEQSLKKWGDSAKQFNWRSLKKIADPKAAEDLNAFLEKLPQNTGQTMLIIAGTVWAFAGATGLYSTVQLQKLTAMKAELQAAEAIQPVVPEIRDVAVSGDEVNAFIERTKGIYGGLTMKAQGSSIVVTSPSLAGFGQFREAIAHVQNGGEGWRVSIEKLCVGRECEREPLAAILKINKVSVQTPG
jgi:hypothetical protein